MFQRVAAEIAKPEAESGKWADIFYELMADLRFLPNSPTLMNAGLDNKGTYSGCFVLPIADDIDSIFDTVKNSAKIAKFGGGVGYSFSNLRPADAIVGSTRGTACLTGDTILINPNPKISIAEQTRTIKELFVRKSSNGLYPRVKCMVDDGLIGANKILGVFYSGKDYVYTIKTKGGYQIKATANHRFLTTDGYVRVDDFCVGSLIAVNGKSTKYVGQCKRCGKTRDLFGEGCKHAHKCWSCASSKASYIMRPKNIATCNRCGGSRILRQRGKHIGLCESCSSSLSGGHALYMSDEYHKRIVQRNEKQKIWLNSDAVRKHYHDINVGPNNPSWKGDDASENTARQRIDYLYPGIRQNNCDRCDTSYLSTKIEIHHIDGSPYNNDRSNLEILCEGCHHSEHQERKRRGNWRLTTKIFFDEIIEITKSDNQEDVYDVQMEPPYHNFIANGFVSHNSGPVSFMEIFNATTEVIKQGSRRRGAQMSILRVDHPNILSFISCKADTTKLNNFNISVAITDKFMRALKDGKDYKLRDPHTGITKDISAKVVWDAIVKQAHATGEPGLFFIDRANKRHPLPKRTIESTNPCGELPLSSFESCTLGSINVAKYYEDGAILWKKLQTDVGHCVRFLDNVITQNNYPLPEIKTATEASRKIGLGIMGLADLFIKMGIPYDSPEALKLAKQLWGCIYAWGHAASEELGKERGNFPLYAESTYPKTKKNMRNACVTCIAPTGTISIIANCSSGIEPIFAAAYTRTVMDGTKLKEVHPELKRLATLDKSIDIDEIIKVGLPKSKLPEKYKKVFREAQTISAADHIQMQSIFQKYSDSAVSKTINMASSATIEEVAKAYQQAWDAGCVGITVYRDGCRANQVLATATNVAPKAVKNVARKRPQKVSGTTVKYPTHLGKLYVTVNKDESGQPIEVIANVGKSGTDVNAMTESLGRLISVALKFDLPVEAVVKQLVGLSGEGVTWHDGKKIISIPDAIGVALKESITPILEISEQKAPKAVKRCVKCNSENIRFAEGCLTCLDCNYSKCG